jgi:hypothetical protein
MNIELLGGSAAVVQHGENVWLLGCPLGVGAALKDAGVTPTAVLLTRVSAPGLSEIEGNPVIVRSIPLRIGGLEATPTSRIHGWDYVIKSADGEMLWTERGDVSVRDVSGYALALVGNKHRPESFGDNVVTRPWPDAAHYVISGGAWHSTTKPWTTMDDVPANLKKLDDTPLTLANVNWIAHVAVGAGSEGEEKWGIGIASFKKSHHVEDGAWIKNEAKEDDTEDAEEETVVEKALPVVPASTEAELAELGMHSVSFKQQPDGKWRWYAHTTNDTLDLQNEVITPEAIDWSLAIAERNNDRGPLLFRHLPIPLGMCDKQLRVGPMLFESGLMDNFTENPVAQAAVALVNGEPGQWMMSPGLRYKEGDLQNGRYQRCWIVERSLTPVPANLTTAFAVNTEKEMATVTDAMLSAAAEQLGLPLEQIKALAQKYLDANKEIGDVPGLLSAIKEGVVREYAPAPVVPAVAGPDWAGIIQANTAAMSVLATVVKELAAGKLVDAQVQAAVEGYMQQAPQFGSQSRGVGDGDEAVVRAALAEAEKETAKRAGQIPSMQEFEKMFTSRTLNPVA